MPARSVWNFRTLETQCLSLVAAKYDPTFVQGRFCASGVSAASWAAVGVGASVCIFLTLAATLKVDLYSNAITGSILNVGAALIFNLDCGICLDFIREPFPITLSSSCPPF